MLLSPHVPGAGLSPTVPFTDLDVCVSGTVLVWGLFSLLLPLTSWAFFGQDREFPAETVKFGPERMYIDCWVKKHTYDTFKEVLGSGMQYHLQVSGRALPWGLGRWLLTAVRVVGAERARHVPA